MEVIHCKDYSEIYNIPDKNGCYIDEDGNKFYYKNNLFHRIGGPAVEWGDGEKQWYVFDIKYTEDDYNRVIRNFPLVYWKNRDMLWK